MDLILWRHAEAEQGSADLPDEARKLTSKGIKQANKMAHWLDSNLPESCRILVSPTLRTRETMEALDRKFKVMHELAPDATVEAILAITNWPNSRDPVMIIGHQPYLGQVAAHLITPSQEECAIRKGNVWWITQKSKGEAETQTYLKAIMTPDLVVK